MRSFGTLGERPFGLLTLGRSNPSRAPPPCHVRPSPRASPRSSASQPCDTSHAGAFNSRAQPCASAMTRSGSSPSDSGTVRKRPSAAPSSASSAPRRGVTDESGCRRYCRLDHQRTSARFFGLFEAFRGLEDSDLGDHRFQRGGVLATDSSRRELVSTRSSSSSTATPGRRRFRSRVVRSADSRR